MVEHKSDYKNVHFSDKIKDTLSQDERKPRAYSTTYQEQKEKKSNNSNQNFMNINIYTVTWNQNDKIATREEIAKIVPNNVKYHIYAIGSEECMRSIFKSFFISDKSEWERMIM